MSKLLFMTSQSLPGWKFDNDVVITHDPFAVVSSGHFGLRYYVLGSLPELWYLYFLQHRMC